MHEFIFYSIDTTLPSSIYIVVFWGIFGFLHLNLKTKKKNILKTIKNQETKFLI